MSCLDDFTSTSIDGIEKYIKYLYSSTAALLSVSTLRQEGCNQIRVVSIVSYEIR